MPANGSIKFMGALRWFQTLGWLAPEYKGCLAWESRVPTIISPFHRDRHVLPSSSTFSLTISLYFSFPLSLLSSPLLSLSLTLSRSFALSLPLAFVFLHSLLVDVVVAAETGMRVCSVTRAPSYSPSRDELSFLEVRSSNVLADATNLSAPGLTVYCAGNRHNYSITHGETRRAQDNFAELARSIAAPWE